MHQPLSILNHSQIQLSLIPLVSECVLCTLCLLDLHTSPEGEGGCALVFPFAWSDPALRLRANYALCYGICVSASLFVRECVSTVQFARGWCLEVVIVCMRSSGYT